MQTSNGGSLPSAGSGWRRRDHTRGNLLGSLAVLALPSIGTSLAGAVAFQLIDLKFVSELGAAPLAAVVLTNQSLRQLAFLLVLGTSVGAQAIIARHIGEGDSVAAAESTGQVLALGGLLCLGFACIGGLFARPLLALVAHDPAVLEVGVVYVRLTFLLMFGFVSSSRWSAPS